METSMGLQYGCHNGTPLLGDLYLPQESGSHAVIVAVHGGGWQASSRDVYRYMGPHLAERGYAVFSIDYRLTRDGENCFPAAVQDARAAVQWLRSKREDLPIEPARIALMGDSAGAHLAAMVALAGDAPEFTDAYPDDPYAGTSTAVKAVIGVYGVYDLTAQWEHDVVSRPADNITEKLMGFPPMRDRRAWFSASPIAHATFAANSTAFLLAHGTSNDIVDPAQTETFLRALKQSRFYVRKIDVPSAPHFWMADPVEETNSFPGFLAPRLLRFLADRL